MKKLPMRLTNRLRREPSELLEVVKHNYQATVGKNIYAVFPVALSQPLATVLIRLGAIGSFAIVATLAAIFFTGSSSVGAMAGFIAAMIGVILTGSEITFGVVAVTDDKFVLIELNKTSFDGGKVIEQIDIQSNLLPEMKTYKGGGTMHSNALAFKMDEDRTWRYAALDDHGTGYGTLLEELRTFQQSVTAENHVQVEPQLVG